VIPTLPGPSKAALACAGTLWPSRALRGPGDAHIHAQSAFHTFSEVRRITGFWARAGVFWVHLDGISCGKCETSTHHTLGAIRWGIRNAPPYCSDDGIALRVMSRTLPLSLSLSRWQTFSSYKNCVMRRRSTASVPTPERPLREEGHYVESVWKEQQASDRRTIPHFHTFGVLDHSLN
jgi:hypothetical protein